MQTSELIYSVLCLSRNCPRSRDLWVSHWCWTKLKQPLKNERCFCNHLRLLRPLHQKASSPHRPGPTSPVDAQECACFNYVCLTLQLLLAESSHWPTFSQANCYPSQAMQRSNAHALCQSSNPRPQLSQMARLQKVGPIESAALPANQGPDAVLECPWARAGDPPISSVQIVCPCSGYSNLLDLLGP